MHQCVSNYCEIESLKDKYIEKKNAKKIQKKMSYFREINL